MGQNFLRANDWLDGTKPTYHGRPEQAFGQRGLRDEDAVWWESQGRVCDEAAHHCSAPRT